MAYENALHPITLPAAADFTGKQFYPVKMSGAGVAPGSAAGELVFGVAQNEGATGQPINVAVGGVSKVVIGAAVTPGPAKIDATGRAVNSAATAVSGANVNGSNTFGVFLESGTAAGQLVSVLIMPMGVLPTNNA